MRTGRGYDWRSAPWIPGFDRAALVASPEGTVHIALSWFAAAYVAVLAAELIGDRSLYAISALTARFGAAPVLSGLVPAFAAKALAAVLLGGLLARLPHPAVAVLSMAAFLASAVVLWRERDGAPRVTSEGSVRSVAVTAFSSIFFTEWADAGQLMTATLAARSHAAAAVWTGATLALTTKGVLAIGVGIGLRRVAPTWIVRRGAVAICLALGFLSLLLHE